MKKNRIALIIGLLLGSIALWLILIKNNSTIKLELRDFAIEDTSQITKIFMANKANQSVLLEKVKSGLWKVNNKYIAKTSSINLLLYTMKALEVKSPIGTRAMENVIKRLSTEAIKVEIYTENKLIRIYYVGTETQDQLGTYMLLANPETMENSSVPFIMHIPGFNGFLTTRYFTNESDWKSRTLFSYIPNQIKSIKIETPEKPEYSYEIHLTQTNKYTIVKLSTLESLPAFDTLALKQYLSYFQNIQYGANANSKNKLFKDSLNHAIPMDIITVTDLNSTVNKIKLFAKAATPGSQDSYGKPVKYDPDEMYALINDEKDPVFAQYFVFGKLLPSISYFFPPPSIQKPLTKP